MHAFNRIVVILLALVLIAASIYVLLVAVDALEPESAPGTVFQDQLQTVADATGGERALYIAIPIILALVLVGILTWELTPGRRPMPFLINSNEGGVTTIDRESVRLLAEKTAATNRGVREVHCETADVQERLSILCYATVAMGTNIPELGKEIQDKIKESVENYTGLPVTNVNVKAKYETVEAKRLGVT